MGKGSGGRSPVHVLLVGLGQLKDGLPSAGVQHLEGLARSRVHPLAVDQQLQVVGKR